MSTITIPAEQAVRLSAIVIKTMNENDCSLLKLNNEAWFNMALAYFQVLQMDSDATRLANALECSPGSPKRNACAKLFTTYDISGLIGQANSPDQDVIMEDDTSSNALAIMASVAKSFAVPYQGDTAVLFRQNLEMIPTRPHFYSNVVPVCQTSAGGKSRLVDELAKLVTSIPINLLDILEEEHNFSYPRSDRALVAFFARLKDFNSTQIVAGIHQLLRSIFTLVLELILHPEGQKQELSQPSVWREFLETPATAIFSDFKDICSHVNILPEQTVRNVLYSEAAAQALTAISDDVDHKQLARTAAKLLLESLAKLPGNMETERVKIVIYFDEAHTLYSRQDGNSASQKDLYDHLQSCVADLAPHAIVTVFLSTTTRVHRLAPPAAWSNSARGRLSTGLTPPITELPFDCHPKLSNGNGLQLHELTLRRTSSYEFIAMFGRPWFWSYLQANNDNIELAADQLLITVQRKLINSGDAPVSLPIATPDRIHIATCLALLDPILRLDYDLRRASTSPLQAELVASHMMWVWSISDDRSYLQCGYPSEPFVAEAILQLVADLSTAEQEIDVLGTLLRKCLNGACIDTGQKGENIAKVLLIKAMMAAVLKKPPSPRTTDARFSRGCSVIDFLTELLGEEHAKTVLDSIPANINNGKKPGQPLKEVFANAWIRFTHFVKLFDDSGFTTHAAAAAFARGMAFIGFHSQYLLDFGIPIFLCNDSSDNIIEAKMTMLLIQVKLIKTPSNKVTLVMDAEELCIFPTTTDNKPRPYITLVMELGVDGSTGRSPCRHAPRPRDHPPKPPTTKQPKDVEYVKVGKPPTRGEFKGQTKLHPRYYIGVFGCSSKVYKVIKPQHDELYRLLLPPPFLLHDHPRQDADSISAVTRAKPAWGLGKDIWHWVDDGYLQQRQGY